jgi:hypothetical protein
MQLYNFSNTYRVPGVLSLGIKRPRLEADLSPPSSTMNEWSYTSTPSICLHGVVLSLKKKHRYIFTFTLPYHNTCKIVKPIYICYSGVKTSSDRPYDEISFLNNVEYCYIQINAKFSFHWCEDKNLSLHKWL